MIVKAMDEVIKVLQPLAILAVTIVGAWIAYDKLQLDKFDKLYPKRVKVYEETRKILAQVFEGGVSESDLRAYDLTVLDAQFLFDDAMYQYLRQIRQCIAELIFMDAHPPPVYETRKAENLNWLIQQGDDHSGFAVRFRRFLEFPKRPPWLRWLGFRSRAH
jgi:hypothetical protein